MLDRMTGGTFDQGISHTVDQAGHHEGGGQGAGPAQHLQHTQGGQAPPGSCQYTSCHPTEVS